MRAQNTICRKRKKSRPRAQGHSTAQLLCCGASMSATWKTPPTSYCSVEEGPAPSRRIEGAACLPGPSSQPVWVSSSTGITFSSGSHRPPLGLQAIFLLHWPRAALLVSPEVSHSDKIQIRVSGGQLSSSWASFPLGSSSARNPFLPVPLPRNQAAPTLPAFRTWALGGEAQPSRDFPGPQ